MNERRGVVVLAGAGEPTHVVVHALEKEFDVRRVVIEDPVDRRTFLERRVKRLGVIKVVGQVAFAAGVVPVLERRGRRRIDEIARAYDMDRAPVDPTLVVRVPSVNDDAVIALLREVRPAAIVVQGTRILAKRLIEAAGCPMLNMHAGITPLFRGVHGGYWALATRAPELCGVTVHLVDPGIDTGGVLYQARITPTRADSYATYPWLQLGEGLPLLRRAVRDALEDRLAVVAGPSGASRLWTHPTIWEYAVNRVLRGVS